MLGGLVTLIVDAAASFFTMMLLTRALMRWLRISFITPLGQFILATTDWAVVPTQKLLPSHPGPNLACWLPAWLIQVVAALLLGALGAGIGNPVALLSAAALVGSIGLVTCLLQLVMLVVIVSAVLSWVNPHAPVAPFFRALARPFLAPIARRLPLVGGVDLSPLVVLLIIQILLYLLANFRVGLRGFMF